MKCIGVLDVCRWDTRSQTMILFYMFVKDEVCMSPKCLGLRSYMITNMNQSANVILFYISVKDKVCMSPECLEVGSYMLSNMNETANPCDDFFKYACGGWQNMNPVPYGYSEVTMRSKTFRWVRNFIGFSIQKTYLYG